MKPATNLEGSFAQFDALLREGKWEQAAASEWIQERVSKAASRAAWRWGLMPDSCEDIAQEVLSRLMGRQFHVDRYDATLPGHARKSYWLTIIENDARRVARHSSISERRRKSLRYDDSHPGAEELCLTPRDAAKLITAVAKSLSERDRLILEMKLAGLTPGEMAGHLTCSTFTIYRRLRVIYSEVVRTWDLGCGSYEVESSVENPWRICEYASFQE